MINVFIGYDPAETVAFYTLAHSIERHSSVPVSITPLALHQLKSQGFEREWDAKQSTEFSFSRFMVPSLCDYEGWALFLDADMLFRTDIKELWDLRDNRYAVMCVQHDHKPTETVKFLGRPQTAYARKNWSSVMLFNNAKCHALTPEYVSQAAGLDLHQFKWIDDSEIGALPPEWNHLVSVDPPDPHAKNVHYTLGTPCFDEYRSCEYSDEWFREKYLLNSSEQKK